MFQIRLQLEYLLIHIINQLLLFSLQLYSLLLLHLNLAIQLINLLFILIMQLINHLLFIW